MFIDWKLEIAKLVSVKQTIALMDDENLWPHHLPRVAASQKEIKNLEEILCRPIPEDYSKFLSFVNGWPGFYQNVNLFGTAEFIDKGVQSYSQEIFANTTVDEEEKRELLVIASTKQDIDLFCLHLNKGEVVWFAGVEVERFSSFCEFYLAMVDYNRKEVEDLMGERTNRGS